MSFHLVVPCLDSDLRYSDGMFTVLFFVYLYLFYGVLTDKTCHLTDMTGLLIAVVKRYVILSTTMMGERLILKQ